MKEYNLRENSLGYNLKEDIEIKYPDNEVSFIYIIFFDAFELFSSSA